MTTSNAVVTRIEIEDIRFPTSLEHHGSDAIHGDPDYSCAYVRVYTNKHDNIVGHGIAFTLGKGTDIIVKAMEVIRPQIIGKRLGGIYSNFGKFWHNVNQEGQLRWLGPEKGVTHMASSGIFNALWDMWAKIENKPVWKLLTDMSPEEIVSLVDFSYITDAITKTEAIEILRQTQDGVKERESWLLENGYPAYTTSVAWLGYSDETLTSLCKKSLAEGWTKFKVKVGADLADDKRRCAIIRKHIGYDNGMMVDANQRWDVADAISWMKELAEYKPIWIEEPTNPDDIFGHAQIAKALEPLGIGVATGECCQNRVMFKQFLMHGGITFAQIDSCRLGSVNENIAVLLMAKKYGVPVCPHAGGVGLCELVQHLIMFDFLRVSGTTNGRVCEYVDHLHQHFVNPTIIKNASYVAPKMAGYSSQMINESIENYTYPHGKVWKKLFADGTFKSV